MRTAASTLPSQQIPMPNSTMRALCICTLLALTPTETYPNQKILMRFSMATKITSR